METSLLSANVHGVRMSDDFLVKSPKGMAHKRLRLIHPIRGYRYLTVSDRKRRELNLRIEILVRHPFALEIAMRYS